MWENNRQKTIKNTVLTLLILILTAVLVVAIVFLWKSSEEHEEQLSAIHAQQLQKQTAEKQETLDVVQVEYEKDLDCVKRYVPGIVCWGDSLTLGASGSVSYPSILQKYINTYICDIYDFRSTIENADDYAAMKWDDFKVSIPVVNMGAGPETTGTILGRCGAVPFVTKEAITIPAETEENADSMTMEGTKVNLPEDERITLPLSTVDGKKVNPLTGGNAGINNVTIAGIEGVLSVEANPTNKAENIYYFKRITPGEEVEIPAETSVYTSGAQMYRDYIHVVCIGTYGGFSDPDELVYQVQQLVARQTNNSDRFIVLGMPALSDKASRVNLDAVDASMLQAFGDKYISVRKYLCSDGLTDAKISMTKEDVAALSRNIVPPCFFTSSNGVELNGKANTLIGRLIFNQMEELGYFDEIYEELKITETIQEILKASPNYFQNVLSYLFK